MANCHYLTGEKCGAEGIIISSLSGKAEEGGNIFYQDRGDRRNCKVSFPNCNTFRYVKRLK